MSLSCCLIFCQFQPDVAYNSVAYKKTCNFSLVHASQYTAYNNEKLLWENTRQRKPLFWYILCIVFCKQIWSLLGVVFAKVSQKPYQNYHNDVIKTNTVKEVCKETHRDGYYRLIISIKYFLPTGIIQCVVTTTAAILFEQTWHTFFLSSGFKYFVLLTESRFATEKYGAK